MENEYNNLVNEFAEDISISPDLLPATNYSLAHNPTYYLLKEATSFEDEIKKLMWSRPRIHQSESKPYSRAIEKPLDIPKKIQSKTENDTKLVATMNSLSLDVKTSINEQKPKRKDIRTQVRPSNFWNYQLFAIENNEIADPFWTELWLERHWPSRTALQEKPKPRESHKKSNHASFTTRLARPRKTQTTRDAFAAQNQTLRFPFSRTIAGPSRQKTNRLNQ